MGEFTHWNIDTECFHVTKMYSFAQLNMDYLALGITLWFIPRWIISLCIIWLMLIQLWIMSLFQIPLWIIWLWGHYSYS